MKNSRLMTSPLCILSLSLALSFFAFLIRKGEVDDESRVLSFLILPSSVRFTIDAAVGWDLVESSVFESLFMLSIIMFERTACLRFDSTRSKRRNLCKEKRISFFYWCLFYVFIYILFFFALSLSVSRSLSIDFISKCTSNRLLSIARENNTSIDVVYGKNLLFFSALPPSIIDPFSLMIIKTKIFQWSIWSNGEYICCCFVYCCRTIWHDVIHVCFVKKTSIKERNHWENNERNWNETTYSQ